MSASPQRRSFLRRLRVPHVYTLLMGVILVCAIMTYILPSGSYQREERTYGQMTRTVVIPGTFDELPKRVTLKGVFFGDPVDGQANPTSVVGFLTAVPRGMESAADIIFFIFIIGGVFGILQRTGTISAVLQALLQRFRNSGTLLTVILMTVIAIGGSTLGMGEELIPLIPVFLVVAHELGYDRIFGLSLVMLAADVGFAASTTNPFTVQIAQGIAELPLGSGMGFRVIFLACCLTATILYVLRYGERVRKDPTRSILYGEPEGTHSPLAFEPVPLTRGHVWVVAVCALIFAGILYAVQTQGWWLAEMGGGFLLMGIVAAAITRLSAGEATKAFVRGTEEMVVAALVVGFAKGIQVVLEDAFVMDTLIYSASSVLQTLPRTLAAEGMLVFQSSLNFFIPSGSGQAAVTMPLMAPLADVLGLTRQAAVFAFTCGDGFSNSIIPTSAVLMAMLGLANVPYGKWLRFMLPLFLILSALSAIFLAIAVLTGY